MYYINEIINFAKNADMFESHIILLNYYLIKISEDNFY